jgi:opacity protein-like surface antigen
MKRALFLFAISGATLAAQSWYPHHNATVGLGAGLPRGDLAGYFDNSFGVNLGYGYRFHRNFQADAGFETLFGAAGVRDFYTSDFGALRIKDYQFLVPLGGRAILPLARGRLLLFGGGGGAYMRYQERIRQPIQYYRIDCPVCSARSGWGYYALAGASVALDRYQRFRLGASSRLYRGYTEGESLGLVQAGRTRDHWVNLYGEFGISF